MTAAVLGYLGCMSLALLACMGADKRFAAARRPRIPEATLLSLAVLGGGLGGVLGMLAFRHKTRKRAFALGLPLLTLCQLALVYLLFWRT